MGTFLLILAHLIHYTDMKLYNYKQEGKLLRKAFKLHKEVVKEMDISLALI